MGAVLVVGQGVEDKGLSRGKLGNGSWEMPLGETAVVHVVVVAEKQKLVLDYPADAQVHIANRNIVISSLVKAPFYFRGFLPRHMIS